MRVLIVEDDSAVAQLLQDSLARRQHVVAGTARGLDSGLRLADSADYDCAIVDVDLAGIEALPLVEFLQARSRPFVLITGLFPEDISSPRLQALPRLIKPFDCHALDAAMARACADIAVASGSQPSMLH
jgi:DNA-binding response OmpR family regulator